MQSIDAPEQWRTIPGREGLYEVSDHGTVRSLPRTVARTDGHVQGVPGRVLKPYALPSGHQVVTLWRGNERAKCLVHRLVALAFIGQPEPGQEVCHTNGDPADNHVTNLRWGTRSENVLDEVHAGRHWQTRKTHCKRGHEYTPGNTIIRRGKRTQRLCRACNEVWQAEYRARRAARLRGARP